MTATGHARHVLFVCRGNICRSPMAMALARHRLTQARLDGRVEIDSAGYYDWGPFPREAHAFARRAVEQLCGSDLLAEHLAKRWTTSMVEQHACVIVAEDWMRADFPAGRTVTLRELGSEKGDVDDPYGGDFDTFLDCAREMDRLISSGWQRLVEDRIRA